MDFFTYWNNWRQAYHEGRVVYHQAMSRFYGNQKEAMELWPKMMLEGYKSMMGLMTLKYIRLFERPSIGLDFFKQFEMK